MILFEGQDMTNTSLAVFSFFGFEQIGVPHEIMLLLLFLMRILLRRNTTLKVFA